MSNFMETNIAKKKWKRIFPQNNVDFPLQRLKSVMDEASNCLKKIVSIFGSLGEGNCLCYFWTEVSRVEFGVLYGFMTRRLTYVR